ncbi:unnamed protein product [Clonostachys byssicola]|uniref:Uncharacterized protein n=1 Tax=Clonostachys byssicola TaxID=160290 RepID=A0A9N9U3H2_9HYPO|nr:unnamed protein product [Clonostachys byssicola]
MTINVLIVGASRGIGAELAKQFAAVPKYNVIAAVRTLPTDTNADISSNYGRIQLDQTSPESVAAAAKHVDSVDILILNAAIGGEEYMATTSDERLLEYLASNVVGPHRVIREFLPALRKASGSLARQVEAHPGFAGPYSVSKAAGNMLVVQYQNELRGEGICVAALHPGWVATDMGNSAGDGGMPVAQSVEGLKKVILGLKLESDVKYLNYDGTPIPW